MSTSALRQVVARLATEPALAAELDADPDAFGREHQLTVDEVATLRALRRPGTAAGGPLRLRERLSRSGMGFGGTLGALAQDVDVDATVPEEPPAGGAAPELPPGMTITDLPGGGQLIRYADGATSTVTPNPDGTVHVVERDANGRIIDEFDASTDIAAEPADDEPVSLLDGGAMTVAATAVTGAAVAAALRARARRG